MKFTIILGLLLCALPAKADEFADVHLVAVMGNATASESFNLGVEFDNTTQTLLPDGVQTTTFGSLGEFDFAGFTVGSDGLENLVYRFTWNDLGGGTMNLATEYEANTGFWGKAFALSGPNVVGWETLSAALSGGFIPAPSPTPTPEPSSLALLGLGLLSAVLMSRSRLKVTA